MNISETVLLPEIILNIYFCLIPNSDMMQRITYLITLFLLSFTLGYSSGLSVKKIGLEHGLSNDNISCVTQDKNGFMWFGSDFGLNRYDGNRIKVYKAGYGKENSLKCNGINKIIDDRENDILWIATQDSGLVKFDYKNEIFYHFPYNNTENSTRTGGLTDIIYSKEGNLIVSGYNDGIFKVDTKNDKITHYSEIKGLENVSRLQIWNIKEDNDGTIYAALVNGGLAVISEKDASLKIYSNSAENKKSIPTNEIYRVFIDSKGKVWLGSKNGLIQFVKETDEFISYTSDPDNNNSLSDDDIHSIKEIDGSLWIGTVSGGVNILDLSQDLSSPGKVVFSHLRGNKTDSELSSDYIHDIFRDKFGNIWLAAFGNKINFISHISPLFNHLKSSGRKDDSSLSHPNVSAIIDDSDNNLFIGIRVSGLDMYDNSLNKIRNYSKSNSNIKDNIIVSGYRDRKGDIWFGSFDKGLYKYDKKKDDFRTYSIKENSGYNRIWSICENADNKYILATDGGIVIFDENEGSSEFPDLRIWGFNNNLMKNVHCDKNNNIWIASLISGLSVIDKDYNLLFHFKDFNRIAQIYSDSEGGIWIPTIDGAIYFEKPETFEYTTFNYENGITDHYIKSVCEGDNNSIWFATNSGISMYDPEKKKIINYDYSNGIAPASFNSGSFATKKDGTIYFGSNDGICFFNSHFEYEIKNIPEVIITSLDIYDKENESYVSSLLTEDNIKLDYEDNTFDISFVSPDYALEDQLEYFFALEGKGVNVFRLNDRNKVSFRNLSPGKYTFKVYAGIKSKDLFSETTVLHMEIKPPFYLSLPAKIIYAIISMVLIWIVISYYLEKKYRQKDAEMNEERLNLYTYIAHELKTPLTLIIAPLNDLMDENNLSDRDLEKVSVISKSADRLLNLINQMMDLRKEDATDRQLRVAQGNIYELINEVFTKYKISNLNKSLSMNIEIENEIPEIYFDKEVVTIIFDNLINNAIKYTPEGKVELFIRLKNDSSLLEIEIRDTGYGIPQKDIINIFDSYYRINNNDKKAGWGIGLAIVKKMINLHKAKIRVESIPGKGSSFFVTLEVSETYTEALHSPFTESKIKINDISDDSRNSMLIVEDNPEILNYISGCFSKDFCIYKAENGREGLEVALKECPDIIISDIMMPVMNGLSMCRELKDNIITSHIPVILLTAKDGDESTKDGYRSGADSYITKPFTSSLLQSRVVNLLRNRENLRTYLSSNSYKSVLAENAVSKLDNDFLVTINNIIDTDLYNEKLNGNFIAEQLCMSYSSFSKKIKSVTGLTSNELIRKAKLSEAENLLLKGEMTITEIASSLGFNNMSHFRQYFKDEFGTTPSSYIKTLKEKNTSL